MLLSQSEYLIATPVGAIIFVVWLFFFIVPRLIRHQEHKAVVKHYGGQKTYDEMIRTEAAASEHKRRTVKYLVSIGFSRAEAEAQAEGEDRRRRNIVTEEEYQRRRQPAGVLVGEDIPPVAGSPADLAQRAMRLGSDREKRVRFVMVSGCSQEDAERLIDFYEARERLRQERRQAHGRSPS